MTDNDANVLVLSVSVAGVVFIVMGTIFLMLYIKKAKKNDDDDDNDIFLENALSLSHPLGIASPNRSLPLNVIWKQSAINYEDKSDGFRINYPKGKYASVGGVNFRANPSNIFPKDEVTLSYDVYFPQNFPWVKGGKIGPGVCLGVQEGDCTGGGNRAADKGSIRVMWRPDGICSMYVYFPTTTDEYQGPVTSSLVEKPYLPFNELFLKQKTLKFNTGAWNSVKMTVRLNDIDQRVKKNGVLALEINGKTERVEDTVLRTSTDVRIQSMFFASWFGGGDASFSTPFDTYSIVKNIRIH